LVIPKTEETKLHDKISQSQYHWVDCERLNPANKSTTVDIKYSFFPNNSINTLLPSRIPVLSHIFEEQIVFKSFDNFHIKKHSMPVTIR